MIRDALRYHNKTTAPRCILAIRNISSSALSTPTFVSTTQYNQLFTFTDASTAYNLPTSLQADMGATMHSDIQMLHQGNVANGDLAALAALMENTIVSTALPDGSTGNVLRSQLKSGSNPKRQNIFRLQQSTATVIPDYAELFISYDIYLQADLATVLDKVLANGKYWMVLYDEKSGGYGGDKLRGDFRRSVNVQIDAGGTLYFRIQADDAANNGAAIPGVATLPTQNVLWTYNTSGITVPLAQWFKLMIYRKFSTDYTDINSGRTWVAIATYTNGRLDAPQVLKDKKDSADGQANIQRGIQNLPPTRLFGQSYSLADGIDSKWCNYEIWTKPPLHLFT